MKGIAKLHPAEGIWMTEMPIPEIGHNDVLIKIKKTAICGTDVHIYNWDEWAQHTIQVPLTIGHEFVGEIAAVGSEVVGLKIGQRVSGEGHITCGHCRNCRAGRRHLCRNALGLGVTRPGCFAEYLSLPAVNAFPLPDNISDDIASIMDPFGNATHTALSFDVVGEDVIITGAGPIGIMAVAIARHIGARYIVITDINDYRLALAEKMGATRVVNIQNKNIPDVMHELGMTEGFDVGMEMSGQPSVINDILKWMNNGGRVGLLGIPSHSIPCDWGQVIFKGLTLKGIYGREMFETWYKMVTMLQSGLDISPVITHHFSVNDFQRAFEVVRSGLSGKVILEWS